MNSEQKCSFLSAIMASKLLSLGNKDKYKSFQNLLEKTRKFLSEKQKPIKYIEKSDVEILESFLKDELSKFDGNSFDMDEKKFSFNSNSLNLIAKILIIFQIYILKKTTTISNAYDFKSICKDLSKNNLKWDEQKNENVAIMILLSVLEVNLNIYLETNKNFPTKYQINDAYEYLNIYYENNNFYHESIVQGCKKYDELDGRKGNEDRKDNQERKENSLDRIEQNNDKKKKSRENSPNLIDFNDTNDRSINIVPEFKNSSKNCIEEKTKNLDPKEICYKGGTINRRSEEIFSTDNGEINQGPNKEENIPEKEKLPKSQHYTYEKRNAKCRICGLVTDYNYFFDCKMENVKHENIVCKFCFPFLIKIELLLGEPENILRYALKNGIDCFFNHECDSQERIQIIKGQVLSENEIQEILEYHTLLKEKFKKINSKNCEKCNDYHPLRICEKLRIEYQQKKNLRACIFCFRPNRIDSKEKYEKCWSCNRSFCSSCFQLQDSIEYHPNEYMHNMNCKYNEKFYGKKNGECTVCGNKENRCQQPLSNEEFLN